jgi:large subunit ribosomal protein L4
MEAPAFQADGAPRPRTVRLPAVPFDGKVHESAMHQAVKVLLANRRQGTAQTKTRGFVSGGNQKPWRQKGTGRARQGSIRSPLWPGGGTTFGPQPREYRLDMPLKLRRLAKTSALNVRARENTLSVIAALAFEEPKTRRMAELLGKMGLAGSRVLLLTAEHSPNVVLSARNIPDVEVKRFSDASTYDILRADALVVEETALGGSLEAGAEFEHVVPEKEKGGKAERREEAPAGKRKAAAKKAPAAKSAARKPAAKKAARPAAKKAAKKPAAKKAKPASKKKKKKD